MHKSAGAIIKNDKGEILLMERVNPPFGWAGPAGHVEEGESPEEAMRREIKEETGFNVKKYKLLFAEFLPWNKCCKGFIGHDWHLYEALEYEGKLKRQKEETKTMKWFSPDKIKNLQLEEAYEYWFKKLNII